MGLIRVSRGFATAFITVGVTRALRRKKPAVSMGARSMGARGSGRPRDGAVPARSRGRAQRPAPDRYRSTSPLTRSTMIPLIGSVHDSTAHCHASAGSHSIVSACSGPCRTSSAAALDTEPPGASGDSGNRHRGPGQRDQRIPDASRWCEASQWSRAPAGACAGMVAGSSSLVTSWRAGRGSG